MMFQEPALLHQMLSILADNIGDYANFQVRTHVRARARACV